MTWRGSANLLNTSAWKWSAVLMKITGKTYNNHNNINDNNN